MQLALVLAALLAAAPVLGQRLPPLSLSDRELRDLVDRLRAVDSGRAAPGQVQLDFQGHTGSADTNDRAPKRLFRTVDSSLLRRPSFEALLALQDNFERETGVAERENDETRAEVDRFLDVVLASKVWATLGPFLRDKGHPYARDRQTMKKWLKQLWFEHYSRARGRADTSGFEHVFVGEAKGGEVSGLHNWLRFYQLERNATADFDYRGFLVKRGSLMAALRFQWAGLPKRAGSLLIGTSPEFELALYTLCFLSRRGSRTCDVELDGCPLSVTSYDIVQNGKLFIGSIFPSAGRMTDQCRRNSARR